MVKIEFIELIIDALVGGDALTSTRGKYHPRVVEEWVSTAMLALVEESNNSPKGASFSALLQEYGYSPEIPVVLNPTTGKYEAVLPASPMGGEESVFDVSGDGDCPINLVRAGFESVAMSYLKDCGDRAELSGKSLVFRKKPKSSKVYVRMIPSLNDLDDDAEFNVPGSYRLRIIQMIMEFLRVKEGKVEDVQNNQVEDGGR
jgi:hypothetical protein